MEQLIPAKARQRTSAVRAVVARPAMLLLQDPIWDFIVSTTLCHLPAPHCVTCLRHTVSLACTPLCLAHSASVHSSTDTQPSSTDTQPSHQVCAMTCPRRVVASGTMGRTIVRLTQLTRHTAHNTDKRYADWVPADCLVWLLTVCCALPTDHAC